MAQIVNQFLNPNLGGFRHYSGLLPANPGDGGSQSQASVRRFHVAVTNAAAIFRGDIVTFADGSHGVPGAADLPQNIAPPSATPATTVIGNGGGSGLGNPAMAPNAARWVPGDTTSVIAGVCVGFGDITLYMAKNGFQFVPATFEAWLSVETDPQVECTITMPTVPGGTLALTLGEGIDVQANAGFQQTRFGISGLSLNASTIATTATLPLRLLNAGNQIGNDVTALGSVARVMFNQARHFRGGAPFIAD